MSRKRASLSIIAILFGGTAMAEVPKVAVDVAPVHSLVARIMEGVGAPALILQPGASPHEYSLRPSEAAALQEADLVFWVGEDLTPWMKDAIETLANDAAVTTLLETDGTTLLAFREGTLFEEHDDHGHDDHDHEDHAGDDEHGHDDHGDKDDAGHDHGAYDPHAWLSPKNAGTWLNTIAAQLSATDPGNASVYFANAAAARGELDSVSAEVNATLDAKRGGNFIVFHDAYQYFENDFDFPAAGAISLSDATDPSPARITEIQQRIRDEGVDCVLAEPQFNPGLVSTVLDGTEAETAVIDPIGVNLEPGPTLYPQLIRNMAKTLADCL